MDNKQNNSGTPLAVNPWLSEAPLSAGTPVDAQLINSNNTLSETQKPSDSNESNNTLPKGEIKKEDLNNSFNDFAVEKPIYKAFVKNLPLNTPIPDLQKLFEQFGTVIKCEVVKRWGFVELENEEILLKSIAELNNTKFNNELIKVERSHSKPKVYKTEKVDGTDIKTETQNGNSENAHQEDAKDFKILVKNLPLYTTAEEIQKLFESYSPLGECRVIKKRAFVQVSNEETLEKATNELNDTSFKGNKIIVQKYVAKYNPNDNSEDKKDSKFFKMIIENYPADTKISEIEKLLEPYGSFTICHVGEGRCTVHIKDEEVLKKAISELNGRKVNNSDICVRRNKAKKKKIGLGVENAGNKNGKFIAHVRNFPRKTSPFEIKKLFSRYGKLNRCQIIKNYAFVEFDQEKSLYRAIGEMNNYVYNNCRLTVQVSKRSGQSGNWTTFGSVNRRASGLPKYPGSKFRFGKFSKGDKPLSNRSRFNDRSRSAHNNRSIPPLSQSRGIGFRKNEREELLTYRGMMSNNSFNSMMQNSFGNDESNMSSPLFSNNFNNRNDFSNNDHNRFNNEPSQMNYFSNDRNQSSYFDNDYDRSSSNMFNQMDTMRGGFGRSGNMSNFRGNLLDNNLDSPRRFMNSRMNDDDYQQSSNDRFGYMNMNNSRSMSYNDNNDRLNFSNDRSRNSISNNIMNMRSTIDNEGMFNRTDFFNDNHFRNDSSFDRSRNFSQNNYRGHSSNGSIWSGSRNRMY